MLLLKVDIEHKETIRDRDKSRQCRNTQGVNGFGNRRFGTQEERKERKGGRGEKKKELSI